MITSGDIEFEPPTTKIYDLTNSIVMLIAGDAAAQREIYYRIMNGVRERLQKDSNTWMTVWEAANIASWNIVMWARVRAERTVLMPLQLDHNTFMSRQQEMRPEFFKKIMDEIAECRPNIQTIIAGVDPSGAHIYQLDAWGDSRSGDAAGFVAIGAGQRHAQSQLMFAGHASSKQFAETMLLTYSAKRRAEVAPGVGEATDMVAVVGTGGLTHISSDQLGELERFYTGVRKQTERAVAKGDKQVKAYFQALLDAAIARSAAAANTGEQAAPTATPSTSEKEGSASPPTVNAPEKKDEPGSAA